MVRSSVPSHPETGRQQITLKIDQFDQGQLCGMHHTAVVCVCVSPTAHYLSLLHVPKLSNLPLQDCSIAVTGNMMAHFFEEGDGCVWQ